MLTRKQKDLLVYIHERMKDDDVAPSFEEMKQALGLRSKSGIHRLINSLVERGYIERLPNRARALQVRRLPEGARGNVHRLPSAASPSPSIPLYGRIAAGTPIEAIRDEGTSVEVPSSCLGSGEHYALEVDGDSMVNAGINDRDIVIIRKAETASNGDIVVALVDGREVTLKRFRRSGNRIILEPENDAYEPRVLEPERVQVQGHLAGLYRTYH